MTITLSTHPMEPGIITVTVTPEEIVVDPIKEHLENLTKNKEWGNEVHKILNGQPIDDNYKSRFHILWTESGHRIRDQIGDDRLVVELLKKVLPPYKGDSIKLYRGENHDRWDSKQIGLCWTSLIEQARMFGRGLNATGTGGVLLEADCPPEAIIAGPSDHSLYLGENEFTVDPNKLSLIMVIETYPPSH